MEPAQPVAAYIGRWRPSSVSPRAAVFARDVVAGTAPAGRDRAKNLLWAAAKLADYGLGLGLEPVPEVLLHPSVTERFTRCAPGLPAWHGGRCARTCGSSAAGWCRSCIRRTRRCPGNGPSSHTARRKSAAS